MSPRLQKLDALLDFLVERLVAEGEEASQATTPAAGATAAGVTNRHSQPQCLNPIDHGLEERVASLNLQFSGPDRWGE